MENASTEEATGASSIRIEASFSSKVNLADYQNSVPVLRELRIVNATDDAHTTMDLVLESAPAFIRSKTWHIERIDAQQHLRIGDLDVGLDGGLLSRLTESEIASVRLNLHKRGQRDQEVCNAEHRLELLPRNQWGGLSHLPDLIAAFVQPNESAIDHVLKQTAGVLQAHGKSDSLDGYAAGAARAWEIASALWTAIVNRGLVYALPPASFEQSGQKIRSAGQIWEAGIATCLELSLLFCAALEQGGLNPLMIFADGHAFPGLWLKPEEFSTTVIDDITALRKRVKLKELVIFEATLATQRPHVSFTRALDVGSKLISEEQQGAFHLAVDIRRARLQRIKPLTSWDGSRAAELSKEDDHHPGTPVFETAPDLPSVAEAIDPDPRSLSPKDRLERWQRKLLDLSLRNTLLNFRPSKKTLKLEAPDPGALEDLLAAGETLKILPLPDLMTGSDPRSQTIHEGRAQEDVRRAHASDALKRQEIFIALPKEDLESRLVELYRGARTNLQEGGANTLFVAIGFLAWTPADKSAQIHKAPLILIPVSLHRKSVRSGFTLELHEDEPRFNPTLTEMLRQDFHLSLPIADGALPRDDSGLDISAIWKAVAVSIKDIPGWEVTEDVVLSTFSFAKYLMWKDLCERTDQLRQNPVVRHLVDTPRERYASSVPFPDPRRLDLELAPEATFCPLPADSSQLSAVVAGAHGKDFVLIGPPGTGKSQTIANLISQCLAQGKRVLFVSEKIAALNVVYRRLQDVGLAEFCLELHSNKARKADVLAQLQSAWEARGAIDPELWKEESRRLTALRERLNVYVTRLHHRHPNGLTLFDAIGTCARERDVCTLNFSWPGADHHTQAARSELSEVAVRLGLNASALGSQSPQAHPTAVVEHSDWSPVWQTTFMISVRDLKIALANTSECSSRLLDSLTLPHQAVTKQQRAALLVLGRSLLAAAGRPWAFSIGSEARSTCEVLRRATDKLTEHAGLSERLNRKWSMQVITQCQRGLEILERIRGLQSELPEPWPTAVIEQLHRAISLLDEIEQVGSQLSVAYGSAVDQLDLNQLQRDWNHAEQTIWPSSWMTKRNIRTVLQQATDGTAAEARTGEDLSLLVRRKALRSAVNDLKMSPLLDGIWSGLDTRRDAALTAVSFQAAIRAAAAGEDWQDENFESISGGWCGEKLSRTLTAMRSIKALDSSLSKFSGLQHSTSSIGAGRDTRINVLQAALAFETLLNREGPVGPHEIGHDLVAQGVCGEELRENLEILRRKTLLEADIAAFHPLAEKTDGLWRGLDTNQSEVDKALKFGATVSTAIIGLNPSGELETSISRTIQRVVRERKSALEPGGAIALACNEYSKSWHALQTCLTAFGDLAALTDTARTNLENAPLDFIQQRCESIQLAENKLHSWCAWRKVRQRAIDCGLGPLVVALESGRITPDAVPKAFEINYSRWWLNAAVNDEEVVRTFVSAEHEQSITDFRRLDDRLTALSKAAVRALLCREIPDPESVSKGSEWGVLRYEMSKKKRHLPLRELMTQTPTALTRLAPCLLMSPLSIAQYLSTQQVSFDLVIFDEASQIPVWDAIGAIARGKQVVMVGDPKQLPPTNFFDRAEADLDDEDIEGDLESILDECIGANIPTLNLAWHYRSRHESLIAFSNHRYYEGGLVTFPSPVTDDRAVSFHRVAGTYEKGGARINKPEARALVADLVKKIKSESFRKSGHTVGVVTFNIEQKTLIEDLLDDERRKDPSLEPYFDEASTEPLFIKNLESVQGDERDVMYFSIAYGPDLAGQLSMNFGPMNRAGGERRLNVAITRARRELLVFASFRPDQMNLAKTQAIGVRDLKHFLKFAEKGSRALAEATQGSVGGFESPFEEAVAAALAKKGWELHTQVGVSAFRIDLAVVDPEAKGSYLAGIECDGATYHRSATARDRDKLREQVLHDLGWKILRIWSTDWWLDADTVVERIDEKLRRLSELKKSERFAHDNEHNRVSSESNASTSNERPDIVLQPVDVDGPDDGEHAEDGLRRDGGGQPSKSAMYARNVSDRIDSDFEAFEESDPRTAVAQIDPERFFEKSYNEPLRMMIAHVIEIEAPILLETLCRRIARAHGWQRTGTRIQERVERMARKNHSVSKERGNVFFWSKRNGPDSPVSFRRAADGSARSLDEICDSELLSLADVVRVQTDAREETLQRIAEILGLQRLRTIARARIEGLLDRASANATSRTNP